MWPSLPLDQALNKLYIYCVYIYIYIYIHTINTKEKITYFMRSDQSEAFGISYPLGDRLAIILC